MQHIVTVFDFFFGENFPPFHRIVWIFPTLLLLVIVILEIDVLCQKKWSWKVGYTRKFFHFLIFSLSGLLQYIYGIGGVFILGWAVSLVIGYILWKGPSTKYYSLLGRPEDHPNTSKLIIYPYIATFLGGVLNNLLFAPICAIAGYLVVGFGDAIGEPVGAKCGRTRYPVYHWGSTVRSYRSVEGSIAVFLVCAFSFFLVLWVFGYTTPMYKIVIAALIAAIVEGISPHGWDNFTSQLGGAILMNYYLIGDF